MNTNKNKTTQSDIFGYHIEEKPINKDAELLKTRDKIPELLFFYIFHNNNPKLAQKLMHQYIGFQENRYRVLKEISDITLIINNCTHDNGYFSAFEYLAVRLIQLDTSLYRSSYKSSQDRTDSAIYFSIEDFSIKNYHDFLCKNTSPQVAESMAADYYRKKERIKFFEKELEKSENTSLKSTYDRLFKKTKRRLHNI